MIGCEKSFVFTSKSSNHSRQSRMMQRMPFLCRKLLILHQPALFGQNLILILAAGLQVIGHFCRAAHLLEGELADAQAGVEGDGKAVEVADFEGDGAGESRVDE